jgi:hypothetical protein
MVTQFLLLSARSGLVLRQLRESVRELRKLIAVVRSAVFRWTISVHGYRWRVRCCVLIHRYGRAQPLRVLVVLRAGCCRTVPVTRAQSQEASV